MRKALLTLSTIFLLSSFTNQKNEPIILTDIDGTLLKSYVEIVKINGEYTATFTVDANTVVTSNTVNGETHVYLVENGVSNATGTHKLTFKSKIISFFNYFEQNLDVASTSNVNFDAAYAMKPKPHTIIRD